MKMTKWHWMGVIALAGVGYGVYAGRKTKEEKATEAADKADKSKVAADLAADKADKSEVAADLAADKAAVTGSEVDQKAADDAANKAADAANKAADAANKAADDKIKAAKAKKDAAADKAKKDGIEEDLNVLNAELLKAQKTKAALIAAQNKKKALKEELDAINAENAKYMIETGKAALSTIPLTMQMNIMGLSGCQNGMK